MPYLLMLDCYCLIWFGDGWMVGSLLCLLCLADFFPVVCCWKLVVGPWFARWLVEMVPGWLFMLQQILLYWHAHAMSCWCFNCTACYVVWCVIQWLWNGFAGCCLFELLQVCANVGLLCRFCSVWLVMDLQVHSVWFSLFCIMFSCGLHHAWFLLGSMLCTWNGQRWLNKRLATQMTKFESWSLHDKWQGFKGQGSQWRLGMEIGLELGKFRVLGN